MITLKYKTPDTRQSSWYTRETTPNQAEHNFMLRGHYACDNERRDGLIAILSLTIRTETEEKDDEEGF